MTLSPADLEAIRERWINKSEGTTHWEDCWKDHYGCAIELLLTALDETQARIKKLELPLSGYEFNRDLLERITRLEAALREYGRHSNLCNMSNFIGNPPCTCSFQAALDGKESSDA